MRNKGGAAGHSVEDEARVSADALSLRVRRQQQAAAERTSARTQNLQTLFHEGLANKHAFSRQSPESHVPHAHASSRQGPACSEQPPKQGLPLQQANPEAPTYLSMSSLGSDLGCIVQSLNLESDVATSTLPLSNLPGHAAGTALQASAATAGSHVRTQRAPAGYNPLFSDFEVSDLPDAVIARILGLLLEQDFPGAVWSGRLIPQRREQLLASALHAGPEDVPAVLSHFPFDGRPNASTRDVLSASGTCKRWQRLARDHVIKHCAVFGSSPAPELPVEDAEDAAAASGCSEAADGPVQCRPRMQLDTLLAVAGTTLPVALTQLGVPTLQHVAIIADPEVSFHEIKVSAADRAALAQCGKLCSLTLALPSAALQDWQDAICAAPSLQGLSVPAPMPAAVARTLSRRALVQDLHMSWHNIAALSHLHHVTALTLSNGSAIQAEALEVLVHLPALRKLDLSSRLRWSTVSQHVPDAVDCIKLPPAALAHISTLSALQSLSLAGSSRITTNAIKFLVHLGRLTALDLSVCRSLDSGAMQYIVQLQRLVHLNMASCSRIAGRELVLLRRMSTLQSLLLSNCHTVDDSACGHVAELRGLTRLGLRGCSHITENGLVAVRALTRLQWLEVSSSSASAVSIAHLGVLTSMTHLTLRAFNAANGDALWHIGKMRQLASFTLDAAPALESDGLRHISRMTALTALALRFVPAVTDASLACLAPLTELRSFCLQGAKSVCGGGLRHLAGATALHHVDLQQCDSLDACGLQLLAGAQQLSVLNIVRCARIEPADFAGLPRLAALPHLTVTGPEGNEAAYIQSCGFVLA